MIETVQCWDYGYWGPFHPVSAESIIAQKSLDGWELIAVEPAVPHSIPEHRKPPRMTFRRRMRPAPK